MRKLILPLLVVITLNANASPNKNAVVFKCKDSKGNLSYSAINCPDSAKTLEKKTIVSTEGKYGKNRRDYRDDWRDSQYQNNYYRYYRYEKPNVFSDIARKKETEQQQKWDNTGALRGYNKADSSPSSPNRNYSRY